jgi:competence protein ComEC
MGRGFLVQVLILLLCSLGAGAEDLKVFFLDVGEGDAVYMEAPGGKRLLVDTGNPITGHRVVEFLSKRGVSSLDVLITTHPDLDHIGGVFHVLQSIGADLRYDNGQLLDRGDCDDLYRWYADIFRKGGYRALETGDRIAVGPVIIDVLSSFDAGVSDWNTNSLVMMVTYGKTSILLAGDATLATERALLKRGARLKADVIKVGHHGAGDASSERFIEAVSPGYAVISVNRNNIRGYPDDKVVSGLKEKGIEVFFTYRDGDIVFESDGAVLTRVGKGK